MSVDVVTFGCRLNIAESEVIRRAAASAGIDDAVVVNTCAVTAEAVRQARQTIRRIKRERPDARIVVTGCAAQTEPETFAAMPEVDRVLGNEEKLDARAWAGDGERVAVGDIMAVKRMRAACGRQHRGPHPRLRAGAERLRPPLHLLHHPVRPRQFALAADGRRGGAGAPARRATAIARSCSPASISPATARLAGAPRLGALVKRMLKDVPELARLRLSSINSVEADADLLDALANEPRLMPHLHLSLQAGDDLILKRMKRRHTRADAIAFCDAGAPAAAGRRVRRRHHRRLPDRDRRDVRALARSGRRMRADATARVSVLAAPRHAGRAHAAARPRRRQGARAAPARKGRGGVARAISTRKIGARRRVLTERGGIGRTEQFTAGAARRAGRAGRDSRSHRWPATTAGNCWRLRAMGTA